MMRMRETAISLLILALFLLNVSAQSLPINETFGLEVFQGNASGVLYQHECGWQDGGRLCPTGVCCSYYGWCGTTPDYCDTDKCQSQCSGPFPQGRCGWQAADRACPTGLCCSFSGWCGTTPDYCGPRDCQSQCSPPPPPPSPPPPPPPSPPPPPPPSFPQGRCGEQAAGRKCPNGVCCSVSGWCGTTRNYCGYPYCQSQCKSSLTSSPKNRMRGNESFLLNVV